MEHENNNKMEWNEDRKRKEEKREKEAVANNRNFGQRHTNSIFFNFVFGYDRLRTLEFHVSDSSQSPLHGNVAFKCRIIRLLLLLGNWDSQSFNFNHTHTTVYGMRILINLHRNSMA
jgi:hypothetical protein